MYKGKRVLAVIPARGGSKGIPRKNIKNLSGKPLIGWTIDAAKSSKYIDRLILSSEDDEIIKTAQDLGCEVPFKRPFELAKDKTHGIKPILHALEQSPGYDYVMMLQPTSPLRLTDDIDECIEKIIDEKAKSCVSICEPSKSPYWMYNINLKSELSPILPEFSLIPRRQDLPSVYALNGAIYIAEVNWLQNNRNFISKETIGYIMPQERSFDIDTILDFEICEHILSKDSRENINKY